MPDVLVNKRVFYNPVDFAWKQIGGAWKIPILWRLQKRAFRYSELQQDIPHISQKMLTQCLHELEADGFLHRAVFAEVPPRVEYSLTEKGKRSIPIIRVLRDYGMELLKEAGIDYEQMIQEEKRKEVKSPGGSSTPKRSKKS